MIRVAVEEAFLRMLNKRTIPQITSFKMLTYFHKKRHRCIEETFGLYGRRRGWNDLRE